MTTVHEWRHREPLSVRSSACLSSITITPYPQETIPMTALPDFTPLRGGVPIVHDGQVIGAIGVSGAKSAAQDEEVAKAGAALFDTKVAAK